MQTVEEFQIQFRVIFEELNLICFHCRYEMSNCLFESAYEETLRVCNCVPSFHQVALGEMPWLRICTGTKLKCMKKIFHGIGNYKLVSIAMNRIKWETIRKHIERMACFSMVNLMSTGGNTYKVRYSGLKTICRPFQTIFESVYFHR